MPREECSNGAEGHNQPSGAGNEGDAAPKDVTAESDDFAGVSADKQEVDTSKVSGEAALADETSLFFGVSRNEPPPADVLSEDSPEENSVSKSTEVEAKQEALEQQAGSDAKETPAPTSTDTSNPPASDPSLEALRKTLEAENKPPPPSDKDTRRAAFAFLGLTALLFLFAYLPARGFLNDLMDPTGGTVPRELQRRAEPEVATPALQPTREAPARHMRWNRELQATNDKPSLVLFVAEYSTASKDLLDVVFENSGVRDLAMFEFTPYLVYLDSQDDTAGSAEARTYFSEKCEATFLPHICFLNPHDDTKLAPSVTELIEIRPLMRLLEDISRDFNSR